MNPESVRAHCMSFPYTSESVQWGNNLVFKIGGRIFAVVNLEPVGNAISFKCTPEDFANLTEMEGIVPAPYLARAYWVALVSFDALTPSELRTRLRDSYDLVIAKLTRKQRAELGL